MILYYITDRRQLSGAAGDERRQLLDRIREAASAGVDYIQLREKDLTAREFESLALDAVRELSGSAARLLINSRTDIAIAVGAAGVHLPARDIGVSDARVIFSKAGVASPIIGTSCHSLAEVLWAEANGADFALFGPVFEKNGGRVAAGLEDLRQLCVRPAAAGSRMPVVAIGGVALENAEDCLQAGAAGVAGIRLFQQGDIKQTVTRLRQLKRGAPNASRPPKHPYWP